MATAERRPHGPSGQVRLRRERLENFVQVLIMLLIGGAAGAASFRHVHDVAAAHGQPGWLAWADAVVLELASIAGGLELRRNRRLGKSVAFPATMLTVAVFLSLAAQVVEAQPSVIGWIAAALPALGFLAMVKIALGRADAAPSQRTTPTARTTGTAQTTGAVRTASGPTPASAAAVPDAQDPARDRRSPVNISTLAVRNAAAVVPAAADRGLAVPDRRSGSARDRDDRPEVVALVPDARTAARILAVQGTPLSRTALARQMRAEGHQLSNATASALMRILRAEAAAPNPSVPNLSQHAAV
ncbi:DUF2637 domain-containing protein [Micromonospora sp. NPDC049366]|uniref:DUF2637 domain-containing protein n=1 Tax=Micromonospora sp. NPDC049366 TaxID=3364271 RepID=UPI0037A81623